MKTPKRRRSYRIKQCPMCGKGPRVYSDKYGNMIFCCDITVCSDKKDDVVKLWNDTAGVMTRRQ